MRRRHPPGRRHPGLQAHKRENPLDHRRFAVLKAPDVPSILVETAFISNPQEQARLRNPAYCNRLVGAIAGGIRRYFAKNPPLARKRTI